MSRAKYSGFTADTAEHLLLNAGAFFKNFTVGTDTYASAVTAGKLIGATRGGGEFSAVPEVRQIEVDGVSGRAKGLEVIDSWEVYIKATVLEVTEAAITNALAGTTTIDTTTTSGYDIVTAEDDIAESNYLDNITWVGQISGFDDPVIIQVYNALATDGLKLTVQDKNEGTIETTFYGHYDASEDLTVPPFKIYYPQA